MNGPTLKPTRAVAAETFLLGTELPMPLGTLPVNAYLIRGRQPVLVDTGIPATADAFLSGLSDLLDPEDLAYVVLTHADLDHTGALRAILERAPRARLVTTFIGFAKLSLAGLVGPDRILLLNPGQRLSLGDRELVALRPPVFDAPETTAFFDTLTRTLLSSDSFGGILTPGVENAADVPAQQLASGMCTWATIDAPWIHDLGEAALVRRMEELRKLAPERVLSSHLPPAVGMLETLVANVLAAREAAPFVGPDQDELMRMAG